jgi:hypothetical protein
LSISWVSGSAALPLAATAQESPFINPNTRPKPADGKVSKESENKAIVGRWFEKFRGKTCDLSVVDELAAPDMLLQYSLHEPRHGHADIKAFMKGFREAFPDLNFWGAADLIAEAIMLSGAGKAEERTPALLSAIS